MTIASWGFAPALAAGNAVVLKPAELTPLTAIRLGELALEAGLPEGLFAVVTGSGSVVGQRFVSHPDVRKVVFTGSTEVGIEVAAGCARALKPVTLELGGKSANIVFADADLERAAAAAPGAGVRQRRAGLLRAQPHPRAALGVRPLPRTARTGRGRVAGRRPRARDDRDGPAHLGGAPRHRRRPSSTAPTSPSADRRPSGDGFWFAPTVVLAAAAPTASRARRSSDRSSPCCRSTTRPTPSASPTTRSTASPDRSGPRTSAAPCASRAAVKSGVLSVNSHSSVRYWTPFGGMKASGLGRELGPDAAEHFTETKNVFFATDAS